MKPSIEADAKIADILDVYLDWLAGHTCLELDKSMIKRIQEVSKMQHKEWKHVFAMLDTFIANIRFEGYLTVNK